MVEAAFGLHAAEVEAATAVLSRSERRQLYGLLKKLGLFTAERQAHGRPGRKFPIIKVRRK